jgi:hypothetical protein
VRTRTGVTPPVVDSRDVLTDPWRLLRKLCEALDVPFDAAMMAWPPGPRATDGVWARHWYASVEASTGFGVYKPTGEPVPERLRGLLDDCMDRYRLLHAHRLT